ncbi:hypothetical protein [Flavobacterium sp. 25HG05S-40]|uniref:hypothetical protein n=1 Tax=Flavobacterium sp. 25HG05S-40 TaxID=3458682 RepID=UPI004043BB76
MKTILTTIFATILLSSCGIFSSLNSNTSIKPKECFVLGNNKHGVFKTHLTNEGVTLLKIYKTPITGGTPSPVYIKPKETVYVKMEKNTALVIENTGVEYASVTLKVKGDLNLGMSYNE